MKGCPANYNWLEVLKLNIRIVCQLDPVMTSEFEKSPCRLSRRYVCVTVHPRGGPGLPRAAGICLYGLAAKVEVKGRSRPSYRLKVTSPDPEP